MRAKGGRARTFILTPEEKRIVACILGAVVLGCATQHYRATHPRPPTPPTVEEQRAAKLAQRTAAAEARMVRTAKQTTRAQPNPDAAADADE